MYYRLLITFLLAILGIDCQSTDSTQQLADTQDAVRTDSVSTSLGPKPGAHRTEMYLPLISGKKVSMVVNHTSMIGSVHSVDSLQRRGVHISSIFAPEHGFRGEADAGAHIKDAVDKTTGIPVISLYGEKRKPSAEDLASVDVIIFDIQDVGARFYTYISTLHYVMEACAEQSKPLIVLDRPNPNGHYVDGPVRESSFKSFVGMHPVPVVYGMTIGEYAQMINGEGWLQYGSVDDLKIIPCLNYDHSTPYELPIAPSPNLPNYRSVLLYPSLCFFEGTPVSIGRGTDTQFQVIGHPAIAAQEYSFTPKSMFGAAHPKLEDQLCYGVNLQTVDPKQIILEKGLNLSYLIEFYERFPDKEAFFNKSGWFDKLAGTTALRKQIEDGESVADIKASWQKEIAEFRQIRAEYLLYD